MTTEPDLQAPSSGVPEDVIHDARAAPDRGDDHVSSGAYSAAEYIWDNWGHITFWGLVYSFLNGFAVGAVMIGVAEGVAYVIARIAEWAGVARVADRIWNALAYAAGAARRVAGG